MSDHYQTLDVTRDATADQVKIAYRFQLKAFHPDRFSPETDDARRAQDKIHAIVEAYRVLSNASSRAEYDRFLKYTRPPAHDAERKGPSATIKRNAGPIIYISSTDGELESAKRLVMEELESLGYRTIARPGADGQTDLRPIIRKEIDRCRGVVQLVGQTFGHEPATVDPILGRISYTQFEGTYARLQHKKVHYVLLSDKFLADEFAREPEEVSNFQQAYRRRIQIVDPSRYPVVDDSEALRRNVHAFMTSLRGPAWWKSLLWLPMAAAILVLIGVWFVPTKRSSPPTESKILNAAPADLKVVARESTEVFNPVAKSDTSQSRASLAIPVSNPSATSAGTPADQTIPDGVLFGITETEISRTALNTLSLRLSVKARSGVAIDETKTRIQVFFYDLVDRKEVVLTDAEVSYEWLATSHHDWKSHNPEILTVTYRRPKGVDDGRASRSYLGYVARVYYDAQLQDVRADPKTLLDLFVTPRVAPSEESGSEAAARGDYTKAAELFKRTADWGDPTGQLGLAWLYENGWGVPQDHQKAFTFYEMAAATGSVEGIFNLARLYHQGIGVKQNYAKAAELLDQAAAQGSVEAIFRLGWLYENGKGVQRDYYVAAAFFQKAVDKGHILAAAELGVLYELGQGVSQDYNKAAELYREAADRGDSYAQTRLALLYEEGKGVTRDYARAVELFEKVADQGDPNAQTNLGWMYEAGIGVPKDYRKAFELYQKAAAQGYAPGQAYLASLYAHGKGVQRDYRKAIDLYRAAVAQDDPNALNNFAWFLATCPDGAQRNGKEAVSFAHKACEITKWKDGNVIGTLAAAYAESGDFAKAVDYARQSLKMSSLEGTPRRQMERCLRLFRHRQPYRDDDHDVDPSLATEGVDSIGIAEAKRLKTEADTGTADALNAFAWFLATSPEDSQRNGKQAITYATRACQISRWGDSHFISTLAAAYAEVGQFDKAIRYVREALAMEKRKSGSGGANFRQRMQMQGNLDLYQKKKPYRQEAHY